jgi:hypothetical protein
VLSHERSRLGRPWRSWLGFESAFAASPEPVSSATFTSIPIPNGTIFLFTPTVGPDGNIWFPMAKPASIVRVLSHPPYTVTEFPLADEDSYPDGNMVTGPDGNLWFAEQGDSVSLAGKIGRILPHPPYTITEFNTAHPQDVPRLYGLVVGSDRNIYYTETCCSVRPDVGGSVGRITPFGSDAKIQASVTEVVPEVSTCTPVATGTSACDVPRYVTLGPDGQSADRRYFQHLSLDRAWGRRGVRKGYPETGDHATATTARRDQP